MPVIAINNVNQGGIADSALVGGKDSVAEMVGLDIHSESGFIKVNQKLTRDDGEIVDDFIRTGVACSDGNTYLFGSTNGNVWKRTQSGVWTLEATVTPSAGGVGIVGSAEYQGYIYYGMEQHLGRWQIGTPWAGRDDDFAVFTNGNADFHAMKVLNNVLYSGDGNLVAQVDAGVFSANALDLPDQYIIKCLGQLGTDLLMGTIINSNVVATQVFRWNTWSVSFTNSDPIPEVGINSFLPTDNFVIVNAGKKGNLYIYNGSTLDIYKQIPGEWTGTDSAIVNAEAGLNFNGIPLFGLSKESGDATTLAIYSLARTNRNYPYVLNCEYVLSTDHTQNIEIGVIIGVGNIFLVSWKDSAGAGGGHGVDRLDLENKYNGAYIVSRLIIPDRMALTNMSEIFAGYKQLPAGCDILFERSINYGTFIPFDTTEMLNDIDRKIKYTNIDIGEATTLQIKVVLQTNGNDAPILDMIHVITKGFRQARPSPDAIRG